MSLLEYQLKPHGNRHIGSPRVEAALYDFLTTDVPYEAIVRSSGVSRQALYSLGLKVFRQWLKEGMVQLDPTLEKVLRERLVEATEGGTE